MPAVGVHYYGFLAFHHTINSMYYITKLDLPNTILVQGLILVHMFVFMLQRQADMNAPPWSIMLKAQFKTSICHTNDKSILGNALKANLRSLQLEDSAFPDSFLFFQNFLHRAISDYAVVIYRGLLYQELLALKYFKDSQSSTPPMPSFEPMTNGLTDIEALQTSWHHELSKELENCRSLLEPHEYNETIQWKIPYSLCKSHPESLCIFGRINDSLEADVVWTPAFVKAFSIFLLTMMVIRDLPQVARWLDYVNESIGTLGDMSVLFLLFPNVLLSFLSDPSQVIPFLYHFDAFIEKCQLHFHEHASNPLFKLFLPATGPRGLAAQFLQTALRTVDPSCPFLESHLNVSFGDVLSSLEKLIMNESYFSTSILPHFGAFLVNAHSYELPEKLKRFVFSEFLVAYLATTYASTNFSSLSCVWLSYKAELLAYVDMFLSSHCVVRADNELDDCSRKRRNVCFCTFIKNRIKFVLQWLPGRDPQHAHHFLDVLNNSAPLEENLRRLKDLLENDIFCDGPDCDRFSSPLWHDIERLDGAFKLFLNIINRSLNFQYFMRK